MLELFCGIGGASEAVGGATLSIDQSIPALQVLRRHHATPTLCRNLMGIRAETLPEAELWWLSPPCQPYTQRGLQKDVEDPRSRPLLHILPWIRLRRPRRLALENVPGFAESQSRQLLLQALEGYQVEEQIGRAHV